MQKSRAVLKGEPELKRKSLSPVLSVVVGGARLLYAGMKLLPVRRKVVLITREPKRITIDFEMLQESIQRDYPDHSVAVSYTHLTLPTTPYV